MKKSIMKVGVILLVSLFMASCAGAESEKEKDAKRVAEMACEMRLIALEMEEDSFEEFSNFAAKMEEFGTLMQELEDKYEDLADDDEFEEMIRKSLKKTPCGDVDLDDIFDFF
jgi:outer membrane murein-binding lipoprotein Lpp